MIINENFSGTGPHVESLEKELAEVQKTRSCVCVNSGTTAIFLALQVASEGRKMRIGVHPMAPSMSYIPILQTGNVPVFLDVGFDNCFGFSKEVLKSSIESESIDGLLSVGMWDQAPYSKENLRLISEAKIIHIEDISQTHLSKAGGISVGRLGLVGCSSLHNNKILSAGEGGYLISNDTGLLEKIRKIRQFGALRASDLPSMNYKLSGIAAKYCLDNLLRIEETLKAQKEKHAELAECFIKSGLVDSNASSSQSNWYQSSCYGFFRVLPSSHEQEYVHRKFSDLGIVIDSMRYGTAPAYKKYDWMSAHIQDCPNTEKISESMVGMRIPRGRPDWEKLIRVARTL